jgi:hypothetical protein
MWAQSDGGDLYFSAVDIVIADPPDESGAL